MQFRETGFIKVGTHNQGNLIFLVKLKIKAVEKHPSEESCLSEGLSGSQNNKGL